MNSNFVLLEGNLTREPQFRTTRNGKETAWFTIACNNTKERDDGSAVTFTNYPSIKTWPPLTDYVRSHLHKGTHVIIKGYIHTGSYKKDGNTIYIQEVYAQVIVPATLIRQARRQETAYRPAQPGSRFDDMGSEVNENEEIPF